MRIGIYIDASNISLSGGHAMRYDIIKEFYLGDIPPSQLTIYLAYDKERAEEDPIYKNQQQNYFTFLRNFGYKVIIKNIHRLIENYPQLIKLEKQNEYLIEENERLKIELKKVDEERRNLLDKILCLVDAKSEKSKKVGKNKIDIKYLKKLIIDDKILEVFDLMLLIEDKEINNEIILLNRRWNENEQRNRLKTEHAETYMIEKNHIIKTILEILREI